MYHTAVLSLSIVIFSFLQSWFLSATVLVINMFYFVVNHGLGSLGWHWRKRCYQTKANASSWMAPKAPRGEDNNLSTPSFNTSTSSTKGILKQAVQACELPLMHFSNSAVGTDPSPVIFLPVWKMRVREPPPRLVVASRDRSLAVNKW